MNKEVKEIVKSINTRKEYIGAPYMTLETKKIDLLLDYINQLETNIDKSIELIEKYSNNCHECIDINEVIDLLEILKGSNTNE